MKRLIALFLILVMAFSLAACGKDENPKDNDPVQGGNNSTVTDNTDSGNSDEVTISIDSVKKAKETDGSLFEYEDVDGGISIIGFNGSNEIVVIPQSIDGKTVVSIGKDAFVNNSTIRGLRISDSVHTIGDSAFMNCLELEVFVSGSGLKKLDSYCFNSCTKLRDVELNQGLESMIQCFSFADISTIEIPSTVTEMFVPFSVPTADYYITIIAETGSYAEQYVSENGTEYNLKFQAK